MNSKANSATSDLPYHMGGFKFRFEIDGREVTQEEDMAHFLAQERAAEERAAEERAAKGRAAKERAAKEVAQKNIVKYADAASSKST